MRGCPNPQRSMLAIVDWGNGCPQTIRCGGLRRGPMRPWNEGLAADRLVLGAQRARLLRRA